MTEPLSHDNDTRKVKCQGCDWEGEIRECFIKKRHVSFPGGFNIQYNDCCLMCGSEDLWLIEEEGVLK